MDLSMYKDRNLDVLTGRQKEIFLLALSGKTQVEISQILGCTFQNVSGSIKASREKLDCEFRGDDVQKYKKQENATKKYNKYSEDELKILTERERQIIILARSGLKHKEIAEKIGASIGTVGNTLKNAVDRLEGREIYASVWNKTHRERINKRYNESPELQRKQAERVKIYWAQRKEEKKEKDRKYYVENRERILEKKRQKHLEQNKENRKE